MSVENVAIYDDMTHRFLFVYYMSITIVEISNVLIFRKSIR